MSADLSLYVVPTEGRANPQAYVVLALLDGAAGELLAAGVSDDKLSTPWSGVYRWVQAYITRYTQPPTRQRLEEEFPDVLLPRSDGRPLQDVVDSFYSDLEVRTVRATVVEVGELLAGGSTAAALERWRTWLDRWAVLSSRYEAERLVAGAEQRLSDYLVEVERREQGAGLPAGWVRFGIPALDDITGGIGPGDLGLIVGRYDVGKTTLMMSTVDVAARDGVNCLVVSPEHSARAILRKLDAMASGLDAQALRLGKLDTMQRDHLAAVMGAYQTRYGGEVTVLGGALGIEAVGAAITSLHPTAVYVDGLTGLKSGHVSRGTPDWLAVGQLATDLKQLAVAHKIAAISVHQAGRSAVHGLTKESLARSDIVGQQADVIVALEAVTDKLVQAGILKCRDTASRGMCYLEKHADGLRFAVKTDMTMELTNVNEFLS